MRFALMMLGAGSLISCVPPSAWDMPPIIGAARDGDTAQIEKLLAHGADPNVRAGVNEWTPVLHAIHKNQAGSVRVLLAHGADVNMRGGHGVTPLIMAAGYGYADIVRILLAAGANTRVRGEDGADALTAAVGGVPDIDRFTVGRCQTDTVKTLLIADPALKLAPGFWAKASTTIARFAGCGDVVRLLSERQAMGE